MTRRLEIAADLAMIVVAVMLAVAIGRRFLLPQPTTAARPRMNAEEIKGTTIKKQVAGVDWAKNGRTLVLALSTGCHFCTESAPFFQRIVRESGRGVKMMAVLPQPVLDSKDYLKRVGVDISEVRRMDLQDIGVQGTPTLLLVDGTGVVKNAWMGKLSPDQEKEVLDAVAGQRMPSNSR